MSYITKISSFVADRDIPNTSDQAVADRVNFFIKKYEPQCLRQILGYSLYVALLAEEPIITDSRFDKLLNGVDYTPDWGENLRWDGLKGMVRDYIYYHYMRDATLQFTGKGVIIPKVDAAYNVSAGQKIIDAWNCFVDKVRWLNVFLMTSSNMGIYPEFTFREAFNSTLDALPINEFDI